jgi:hypothetical protein
MASGRAIVVLGMIGLGIYVLNKGKEAASSVQGLGADTQAEVDAKLALANQQIAQLKAMPIVVPPIQVPGPRPWQQVVGS